MPPKGWPEHRRGGGGRTGERGPPLRRLEFQLPHNHPPPSFPPFATSSSPLLSPSPPISSSPLLSPPLYSLRRRLGTTGVMLAASLANGIWRWESYPVSMATAVVLEVQTGHCRANLVGDLSGKPEYQHIAPAQGRIAPSKGCGSLSRPSSGWARGRPPLSRGITSHRRRSPLI